MMRQARPIVTIFTKPGIPSVRRKYIPVLLSKNTQKGGGKLVKGAQLANRWQALYNGRCITNISY
jgi:hypothetical protein